MTVTEPARTQGSGDDEIYDVVIIGAGPTGLTLANILGQAGQKVLLLEQRETLIDFPRGVGLDDESLRVFQSVGLIDEIRKHTTPFHWVRFIWPSGRIMASVEPRDTPFGWSRRNAFNQPRVDAELFAGLDRFPSVVVRFDTRFADLVQDQSGVEVIAQDGDKIERRFRGRFLVGADGGSSSVRQACKLGFEGKTAATRWLVVDIRNDPIGTPNVSFVLDPKRPFVSIALPGGVRRLEFGVADNEIENGTDVSDETLARKYKGIFSDEEIARLDHIRRRVYVHNARLASSFRSGNAFLAGDAAHLMPVWQGQGFNSGIRDAANLGWKLNAVLSGRASEDLLDTYDSERRPHARDMIDTSVLMGKIFAPKGPLRRLLRDVVFNIVDWVPSWKRFIMTMKWKPMPVLNEGALVHPEDPKLTTPIGQIFPQPTITTLSGETRKLDDVLGSRHAIVSWGVDVGSYLRVKELEAWRSIGGQIFSVYPACQSELVKQECVHSTPIFDPDGATKAWFDQQDRSVYIVRPDRIVGAVSRPVGLPETVKSYLTAMRATESKNPE